MGARLLQRGTHILPESWRPCPCRFLHPYQAKLGAPGLSSWQAAMLSCALKAVAMCTRERPPRKACRAAERHHPCRFAAALSEYHDAEHLTKFEELLEAAVDLDKIPDEYLICSTYDAGLQARPCPSSCASCHSRLRLEPLPIWAACTHQLSDAVPLRCPSAFMAIVGIDAHQAGSVHPFTQSEGHALAACLVKPCAPAWCRKSARRRLGWSSRLSSWLPRQHVRLLHSSCLLLEPATPC